MESITKNEYTKDNLNYLFKDELKTHYLKREGSIGNNIQDIHGYSVNKNEEKNEDKKVKKIDKIKYSFMTKTVICLVIGVLIVGYKYTENQEIKNNKIVSIIKEEYSKDYSREEVLDKVEDMSKIAYSKLQKFVPGNLYNEVIEKYINVVKPEIMNFNVNGIFKNSTIDNTVAVFNEDDIEIKSDDIALAEAVTTSSAISLMDMDVEEISSKNISITLPVSGTVTSIYGARDEVFENVGYHTGVDIANALNTPVTSATDGVVVLAQSMDKYYGNNIEIEKDGVIFKYAHLNQINVSEGDSVSQGDIIGLMGSTGASTGSHLHFEIKIHDRTVDPELLLKIR